MSKNNKDILQTVVKAVKVLDVIALSPDQEMGIAEISKKTSISTSSVHRILITLESLELIEQTKYKKYCLGPKLYHLGFRAIQQIDIRNIARPYIVELANKTGHTVNLGIHQNGELVTIDKVDSNETLRVSINLGKTDKMHSTAMGKVILAYLPKEWVEDIVKEHGLQAFTPNTITTFSELKVELEKIRNRGYAINNEENNQGVIGVAAPVFNHRGEVAGGISISGSTLLLKLEEMEELGSQVIDTARRISQELGYIG